MNEQRDIMVNRWDRRRDKAGAVQRGIKAPALMSARHLGEHMAAPRKIFRIEETAAIRPGPQVEDAPAAQHYAEMVQELSALRAALAAAPHGQSAGANGLRHAASKRLAGELHLIQAAISGTGHEDVARNGSRSQPAQMTRVAHELHAVMNDSEQATQKILTAAEDIDQAANNLSATLKGEITQALAQDILDRVIQIFEACNFQDLTSQRIAKVMAALDRIEDQITRALDEFMRADAGTSMHGPRLDSDGGHVTQGDVDAMFAAGVGQPEGGE